MLKKLPYTNSSAILAKADLSEAALSDITQDMPPEQVMEALASPELIVDYLRFFASAIPAREGVCWALAVVRDLRAIALDGEAETLVHVADWVRDPNETNRRRCMAAAEKLGVETPVGWLCLAVVWSGSGSIVPADLPEVMPPAGLYAKALFGAVALCLPNTDEERSAPAQLVHRLALDIASGGWPGVFEAEGI